MKQNHSWKGWFSSVRAWGCSVQEKRSYNTLRFPMTNRLILLLYPLFIVCMAELNQDKYPSKLVLFISEHPTIMLFNVLIAALIFTGLLLLFRSGRLLRRTTGAKTLTELEEFLRSGEA